MGWSGRGARRRRDERGRSDGAAGAWAAAAVVLGLGGLGFGVAAQLRMSDMEARLGRIEAASHAANERQITTSEPASATTPPTVSEATTTSVARVPESRSEARSDVIHAFEVVFDGTAPGEQRLGFIDDTTGVEAAFALAGGGQFAANPSSLKVRVDEVTFVDASNATVRYVLINNGVPQMQQRIGTAVLVDGTTWKVTRATVCADLEAAGAPCSGV